MLAWRKRLGFVLERVEEKPLPGGASAQLPGDVDSSIEGSKDEDGKKGGRAASEVGTNQAQLVREFQQARVLNLLYIPNLKSSSQQHPIAKIPDRLRCTV